VSILELTSASA